MEQLKALIIDTPPLPPRALPAPDRHCPLLADLLELVSWLKQWHNDYNTEHGTRMGDYFEGLVEDEAHALGFTLDDLRAWKPAASNTRRRSRTT